MKMYSRDAEFKVNKLQKGINKDIDKSVTKYDKNHIKKVF